MIFKSVLNKSQHMFLVVILFLGLFSGNNLFAQNSDFSIKGTVVDETGTPMPGVNIIEKGTANGVITDFDGLFSMTVSNNQAVLVLSFMGYESLEVAVAGQSDINVTMKPSAESLDEVVVIGYGTIKKNDLTGSVGSVDSDKITERSVADPIAAIQGTVPGVQIKSSTGRIGDGYNIQIRGQNSLSQGSPLFVVDGTPTDGIDFLNPEDIARIDILKDASSTAIYGSRGSNGVVIVTTKNGKSAKGKLTVSFDSSYGVKKVARMPDVMSGEKWWLYHQSAYLATTNLTDPMSITPEQLHSKVVGTANTLLEARANRNETFDWYDAVLKTGTQANNYLSISGTSDNGIGYNVGMGYQKLEGNLEKESLDKYSFKTAINHNINDKWSAGGTLMVTMTEQQDGNEVAMRDAFRLNPFTSPWAVDENLESIVGEYYRQPGKLRDVNGNYLINKTSTWNPLLQIKGTNDETRRWNMLGNVYAQFQALDWLSFRTNLSTGYDSRRRGISYGPETQTGASGSGISAEIANMENFNYTWDNQFNIDYTHRDKHRFALLGVVSMFSSRTEGTDLSSREMPFDTGYYNLGSGAQSSFNLGSFYRKESLLSYTLRFNYAFNDRYLLTFTNRWDGSSLFPDGNKWDSFPSAALAWKINEESFLNESDVLSNLKLRMSYGFTGNNNVRPYSSINNLDVQTYYDFGGNAANGWYAGALANANLGWERTEEFNVGIDFGFLNNRIFGSLDVYNRNSKDLIMAQKLPIESGWETTNANVGSLSNKGVEFGLSATAVNNDVVRWDLGINFSKNTNKIKSIYGQTESDDVGNNLFIGESINSLYNYVFDGIWQADERAEAALYNQLEGQAKVKDINGDGKIDPNDDRVILGSVDPDWTGSFNTRVEAWNFDLSLNIITSQGVKVYSQYHANFTDTRDRGRQKADLADWYIPENGAGIPAQFSNEYPQARNQGTYWRNDKVGYYRDASFVKVQNIQVGYNFQNVKMDQLRLYFNVLEPFVFTDYDGYDPEWADANWNIARVGSVTYQLGLSLKF